MSLMDSWLDDDLTAVDFCMIEAFQLASVVSVTASGLLPKRTSTLVMPSTERSCSAGTVIGPGEGAVPGAGWGKAVERAVWKVMLPSTFCTIWWMCPFNTVTEPKRFNI